MPNAVITLKPGADFDGFRAALRGLIADGIDPADTIWQSGEAGGLFQSSQPRNAPSIALSRDTVDLIQTVVCHRDPERFALLHQFVWRIDKGERQLFQFFSDPLVHRLQMMAKAVRRDLHKMHAFVRFRRLENASSERFIAWFEPDHYIVEATAQFFVKRFPSFDWSIFTPVGSLHWQAGKLSFGPPGSKQDVPESDALEEGWAQYYQSTFNPARTNVPQMLKEMPKKYWRNMPETNLIPAMLHSASSRVEDMMSKEPAAARKKEPAKALPRMLDGGVKTLAELNAIISASEPLVPGATRAVLGEGPMHPPLAFVGEQPGDVEDMQGRPFVGPAGMLLTKAMEAAGIDRSKAYLTNAVKHFKYEQRGKRRLHQTPTAGEVKHYRWWLQKELELVHPQLIVALGATAVLALTGEALPVTKVRGPYNFGGVAGVITVHPSYLLRLPDAGAKEQAFEAFVNDLKQAKRLSLQRQAS